MMDVKKSHVSRARYYIFKLFLGLRYCLDLLIDRLFGIYFDSKRDYIPKVTNKIVLESATALAKKIQRRELTSSEVVKAFIERIHQVNPIINAIVDNRFEEALSEAQQIDADIANGTIQEVDFQDKPFLGKVGVFIEGEWASDLGPFQAFRSPARNPQPLKDFLGPSG